MYKRQNLWTFHDYVVFIMRVESILLFMRGVCSKQNMIVENRRKLHGYGLL